MNENIPLSERKFPNFLIVKTTIVLILLLIFGYNAIIFGQNRNSFGVDKKTSNPMSKEVIDSILKNNSICQNYDEVVKLDTLYWGQYPAVNLDSIAELRGKTADDLAEKALDMTHSKYFSQQPFNLIGTYRETEMRNNINTANNVKTGVRVYDPSFISNELPKARTEKNYYFFKSPVIAPSEIDNFKFALVGKYSNLYYILDYDFLRMYHVPFSNDLGGDYRVWTDGKKFFSDVPDSFRYYKAFKKDSSVYIVLVSLREFSTDDYSKSHSTVKTIDNTGRKSVSNLYKYLLINLNTDAIEKTGYYLKHSNTNRNSSTSITYSATSYETSYKRVGNQYYLDQILINDYKFGPRINLISLSGISFRVDSVITEPLKVIKIQESQADPRKVNYLDYCISLDSIFRDSGHK